MEPLQQHRLIKALRVATTAFEQGIALFPNGDYTTIPEEREVEIMDPCRVCSSYMDQAQELDTCYSEVYQHLSAGGTESDCRIAKNRWCFAKQAFAKARLENLTLDICLT